MKRTITLSMLKSFEKYLHNDEKSKATIEKYVRDIRHFSEYATGRDIDKTLT